MGYGLWVMGYGLWVMAKGVRPNAILNCILIIKIKASAVTDALNALGVKR